MRQPVKKRGFSYIFMGSTIKAPSGLVPLVPRLGEEPRFDLEISFGFERFSEIIFYANMMGLMGC